MIKSLIVSKFKRFEQLRISDFSAVNLLTGRNNCGKTGLLEAIALAATHRTTNEIATLFRRTDGLGQGRSFSHWFGNNGQRGWKCKVVDGAGHTRIRVEASLASQASALLETLAPYTAITFPAWPMDAEVEAQAFDEMVLRRQEKRFENLLRTVEPKLESVRALQPQDRRVLFADVGLSEMIPLSLLGQGALRLSSIFVRALGSKANLLLIDEIENGLHYTALIEVWKGVKDLVETEGLQVFATTHSMECISAASTVFGASANAPLSLHRIEDVHGTPSAISMQAAELAEMLEEGFEIR